ncbi:hypothetical protein GFS31_28580 [Leptolyngbya sp. BL0902]|nr:hypothetical protein GFS31_28580 [Leptolyngbya sp. BL0902]
MNGIAPIIGNPLPLRLGQGFSSPPLPVGAGQGVRADPWERGRG